MPISSWDADARFANGAEGLEQITTAAAAVYGLRIIPPHTALELRASVEETNVKLCRELIFDGELGQNDDGVGAKGLVDPGDVWTSDTEDVDLAGRWDVSGIATTEPILDKTGATIAKSHVMEYSMVDQDDEVGILCSNGRRFQSFSDEGFGAKFLYERAKNLKAGAAYTFSIEHLDDDVLELMQYQVRETRGHATVVQRSWDGSAWQDNITTWIDITGSATLARFADAVTLDEGSEVVVDPSDGTWVSGPAYYEVYLRPKTNYAAGLAHISNIGLHEAISATSYDFRLGDDQSRKIVTGPYWTRIGTFGDGAGTLHVSRLGGVR
jgi:hypothetical protein